ncbi:hypothetical protein LDENG_00131770, partial [Lucifuga dentata]
ALQINNQVLYGRSHQNASAIIKSAASKVKLILLRNEDAINQMAVPPFPTPPPPPALSPVSPESVSAASLTGSTSTDGPRPPDSLTLHPSFDSSNSNAAEESGDRMEQDSRNDAAKSLREAESSAQRLKGVEFQESELQAAKAQLEQQCSRSYSSSSKDTAASPPPLISPDLHAASRDPCSCAVVPGQETVLEIC